MRMAELVMAVCLAIFSAGIMWKSTELPIGWIPNEGPGGGKVFYTSLGHPYDFGVTQFRTMLRNAIYWAVDEEPSSVAKEEACCQ